MKSFFELILLSTLAQIADGLSVSQQPQQQQRQQRQDAQLLRVVGLPIHRSEVRDPVAYDRGRMSKRDGTVSATIDNQASYIPSYTRRRHLMSTQQLVNSQAGVSDNQTARPQLTPTTGIPVLSQRINRNASPNCAPPSRHRK